MVLRHFAFLYRAKKASLTLSYIREGNTSKGNHMNTKKNYKKGARKEIIQLLYQSGVITYRSLRVLPENRRMLGRAVKKLEQERIIEIYLLPKRILFRKTTPSEIKDIESTISDAVTTEQREYYQDKIAKSIYLIRNQYCSPRKKESTRKAIRLIRDSEINALMYSSGATILAGEKPTHACSIYPEDAVYYTSSDIKDILIDSIEISPISKGYLGRGYGLLISHGGIYQIYHTGDAILKWDSSSELRNAIRSQRFLRYILNEDYQCPQKIETAIVIADNNVTLSRMITYEFKTGSWRNAITTIQDVYAVLYGITNDLHGRQLLTIMQYKGWESLILTSFLSHKEIEESNFCTIPCDGYDREKDIYTFVFCKPDLIKFRAFCMRAALENNPTRFRIICFQHQLETVANTIEATCCKVYSIPYDDFISTLGLDYV